MFSLFVFLALTLPPEILGFMCLQVENPSGPARIFETAPTTPDHKNQWRVAVKRRIGSSLTGRSLTINSLHGYNR